MKTKDYIIEFNKLRFGLNDFSFSIQKNLFEEGSNHDVEKINVTCNVVLNKKESMYEMQFDIKGTVLSTCDTCLDDFELPLNKSYKLIVKLIDGPENLDDDEIIYLPKGLHEFDFKQVIYDYFLLAIPSKIDCNDADKEHNQAFMDKLAANKAESEENEENKNGDPRWDALKQFYNKN